MNDDAELELFSLDEVDPLQLFNIGDPNQDLENELPAAAFRTLQVGSRDWTVQTLVAQIASGNIDLDPRFQRRSAWSDTKRSRFIESLIVGVPIPQLVLAEIRTTPGKFVVIDGKQRLLTLAGILYNQYNFWTKPAFVNLLTIGELEGVSIADFLEKNEYRDFRRQFANQSIRAALVVGVEDDSVLYDIFFRLNSGSVPLSGQELRQALLRGPFSNFLFEVTNDLQPIHRVMRIPGPDQRMYDAELVLRALASSLSLFPYSGNLKAFLDDTTQHLNGSWEQDEERVRDRYSALNRAIEILGQLIDYREMGRRKLKTRFEGRLNKALLEVQLYHFTDFELQNVAPFKGAFLDALQELCADFGFRDAIELTTKTVGRFERRFEMFGQLVETVFHVAAKPPPTTTH